MRLLMLKPIAQVLRSRGLEPLPRLCMIWPALLPGAAGKQSHPAALTPPSLLVYADNAGVHQELQLRAPELLDLIHSLDLLPDLEVPLAHIETRPSPTDLSRRRPRPGFSALVPPQTQPVTPKVRDALEDIADPELRKRLERITRLRREKK